MHSLSINFVRRTPAEFDVKHRRQLAARTVPAGRADAHEYGRTNHTRASSMGAQWRHGIGEGITNDGEVRPSQHHADMVFRSG
ncbi:hypothetical protein EF096_17395 [Pseudomonas neustonica]|uniref:Uncharacterized protein n=1 Tax=Pseudomonas neustonica TaxID=2487346 RepID=A0ABX9XDY7_9PSED|nr:hypothetical protein EF096_17395 [Pseudomonas neustonica]ROZ84221.1 hypothetical protein EF099_07870 [Pseudomonas sp. SSM44]